MIYTEYQQVLLTQLQNNDKRIEERKFLDSTIRYFVTKNAHLIKGERYTL